MLDEYWKALLDTFKLVFDGILEIGETTISNNNNNTPQSRTRESLSA